MEPLDVGTLVSIGASLGVLTAYFVRDRARRHERKLAQAVEELEQVIGSIEAGLMETCANPGPADPDRGGSAPPASGAPSYKAHRPNVP